MRTHRVLDDPAVLHGHDHVSWCGPRRSDFTRLAAAVFGTSQNERLLLVGADADLDALRVDDRLDRLAETGALTVVGLHDLYGEPALFDAAEQFETFNAVVDDALARGYRGVRVVADGTPMVTGDDDTFHRWLSWEHLADRFIADRPVVGVCYFDDDGVDAERLDVLCALHPITHGREADPPFRLFVDDGVMVITGEIDGETITTLHQALAARPREHNELLVDVTRAEYIDHRTLQAFARLGSRTAPVRLRGVHPTLRKVWQTLDLTTDTLQLC